MATVPDKALVLAVTKRMLYGEETPLVGVGLMYKPLPFHGAFQCCLHASACVACHGLQCGVSGQTEFVVPYICLCLRNERCDTSCGATSRLVGCGN